MDKVARSWKVVSALAAVGFAALVLAAGTPAFAADQELIGKKLLIINKTTPGKSVLVFLSKDPAIVKTPAGGSGDPILNGGSMRIITSSTDNTFPMPGPNVTDGEWFTNTPQTIWKYRKGDGIAGDACKVALVKGAKIVKAVCKGPDVDAIAIATSAPNAIVEAQLATGDEKYCSVFSAAHGCDQVKDGSFNPANTVAKYLSKNCATATLVCASPSGAFLELAQNLF